MTDPLRDVLAAALATARSGGHIVPIHLRREFHQRVIFYPGFGFFACPIAQIKIFVRTNMFLKPVGQAFEEKRTGLPRV